MGSMSYMKNALSDFMWGAMDQTPHIYDEMAYPEEFMDYDPPPQPKLKFKQKQTKSFHFPTKDGKCPDCGSKLVEKHSQYGKFYSCSDFPTCSYKCSEKQFIAACKNKPKIENKTPEIKKEKNGLGPTVEYKGTTMCDPFGLRCGDCQLYSYNDNKCFWHKEWDVEKHRPGCEMFISRDVRIRQKIFEYYKKLMKEKQ